MDAFAERIKQYSAKEQAELRVRVMLPGNMFPGLSPKEQRDKYEAEATGSRCTPCLGKSDNKHLKEFCPGSPFEPSFSPSS